MIRKITADYIFPVAQPAIKQGVVIVDDVTGEILDVQRDRSQFDASELEVYQGVVTPSFVNTHCHLELSHMVGRVPTGTGLLEFIGHVVSERNIDPAAITEAIEQADQAMYNNGIAAVGDISNKTDTFATKYKSKLRYYTFVECFDFWQSSNAQAEFERYKEVYDALQLPAHHAKSLVPHAPYSVSPALFDLINTHQARAGLTISIHNQETPAENALFLDKNSDFVPFFGKFGCHYDELTDLGKTAIHYALQHLLPNHRTLFVHNTLTTEADIRAAVTANPQSYWATCPNANLYIENRLPNYQHFMNTGAMVTIGTDSLTSNWRLSILDEMKTIAKYQSKVSFETLLQWATLNGAKALGFDDTLGSIETGKRCGLNLLNLDASLSLSDATTVQRLI